MQNLFVLTIPEEEAIRLYRIMLDRDGQEALAFLEEHAKKPLRAFLEGG